MEYPKTVYAIQHEITKKIYIGSSKDPETRYKTHMSALRTGKHTSEEMQKDFNEHGEHYSFFILDTINDWSEKVKEYEWMFEYRTFEREYGYNYKDRARESLFSKNMPPLREGLPEPMDGANKYAFKTDYLIRIIEQLKTCEDVAALDLISRILDKSKIGVMEE